MCRWRCALLSIAVVLWTSGVNVEGYTLYWSVNGNSQLNASTVKFTPQTTESITITCKYDYLLRRNPPSLTKVDSMKVVQTIDATPTSQLTLSYTLPVDGRQGKDKYLCTSSSGEFVSLTISFDDHPTTQVVVTTTTASTSSAPSGSNNVFTGLNPLIYTISAVILLGTLAIVAIITCWIRARRSFNNRSLRSAQTPQDYFDHLSDNEFTPLTSEEFQASLQERPPTYHQSEEIEANTRDDDGDDHVTESLQTDSNRHPLPSEDDSNRHSLPPEEAAIMENLVALNLIPESETRTHRRPATQRRTNTRTTNVRRARATVRGETRQVDRPRVVTANTVEHPTVEQTVDPVERLREVGEQARRMLEERRSVGTLVQLEEDEGAGAESTSVPTREQISEIETTVGDFNSRMSEILERGREIDRRFQHTQ